MLSALAREQHTLDKRLFVPAKSIVFGLLEKGHEKKVLTTKGVGGWTHIRLIAYGT